MVGLPPEAPEKAPGGEPRAFKGGLGRGEPVPSNSRKRGPAQVQGGTPEDAGGQQGVGFAGSGSWGRARPSSQASRAARELKAAVDAQAYFGGNRLRNVRVKAQIEKLDARTDC
jgi:hypothetical protein